MKGIIKLYPATGNIVEGAIIRSNGKYITVTEHNINNLVNPRLFKYYVTNQKRIIGELHFNDYILVNEGDIVEFEEHKIHNKPEIGDECEVFKVPCNIATSIPLFKKYLKGVIIDIKSTNLTVSIHGENKQLNLKRHCVRLVNRPDKKTICKII